MCQNRIYVFILAFIWEHLDNRQHTLGIMSYCSISDKKHQSLSISSSLGADPNQMAVKNCILSLPTKNAKTDSE